MMTEQQLRMMMEMFANPMFKQGTEQFFKIAQQQGMEAAKKFWGGSFGSGTFDNNPFPDTEQMIQRMTDFQAAFGFMPLAKYEELNKEYTNLKVENQLLRDTLRDLQQSFIAENSTKAQQAWQDIADKQLEMSREATKSFFDVMKQQTPSKKGN